MATTATTAVQAIERDEAGNLTATYIHSRSLSDKEIDVSSRIDIISPERAIAPWRSILNAFLPTGYPHSVTNDYLEWANDIDLVPNPERSPVADRSALNIRYQIYDSLQAFSSSIANLLSSRAVLQGIGVGDASASTTAAILLSVLQESTGRIATILFAHKLGNSLEPECKMYRLAADIFNDAAMILDCLSPACPKALRVLVLSISSVLRALCGVAAGSSKASLSAHFARWGNLGELNAKDSSQETVISLVGMLVGSLVVARVSTPLAVWSWLLLLIVIHIATNRAAVRAVTLRTLNRQRANIVFSTLLSDGMVLSPKQVSEQERIFERDGALRWKGSEVLGYARIGVKLRMLLSSSSDQVSTNKSIRRPIVDLKELAELYAGEQYILWHDERHQTVLIALKDQASSVAQLKAWAHGLLVARHIAQSGRTVPHWKRDVIETMRELRHTLEKVNEHFDENVVQLEEAGWDLKSAALETSPGHRVTLQPLKVESRSVRY